MQRRIDNSNQRLVLAIISVLAAIAAGCSTSREYTQSSGVTTNSLPPRPAEGMVREPARPYGNGSSLGSNLPAETSSGYRWNGNPNRLQEGAAPQNPPPPKPSVSNNGVRTIVVRPGDTLYSLSRHHGVTVAALAQHNNLATNTLRAGQTLTLPATAH